MKGHLFPSVPSHLLLQLVGRAQERIEKNLFSLLVSLNYSFFQVHDEYDSYGKQTITGIVWMGRRRHLVSDP